MKVFSATGWCTNPEGAKEYSFTLNNQHLDSTSNNAGVFVSTPATWNLGDTYPIICDCDSRPRTYFKSEIPSTFENSGIVGADGLPFYILSENLYFGVKVYLNGRGYINSPFVDLPSDAENKPCNVVESNASSGSRGEVFFYINKSFVGTIKIPRTLINNVYGTAITGSYPATPISEIFISGEVSVPQNCIINNGEPIKINFGNIYSESIKNKSDYITPKDINVTLKCTNINNGVKVSLSISGNPSVDDGKLKTENDDIGILFEQANGDEIKLNQDNIPVSIDANNENGTGIFRVRPVNITGTTPNSGPFDAIATLDAEIN